MKKLLIILALLLSTLTIFAQGKISGKVIDASGTPLEFVTVTLHHAKDSALVKGALTDAYGKYEFEQVKNGSYHVVAAQVGLKKILSAPLSILDNTLTVNELKFVEEVKTLGAVTITAQKPFIEHQIDKTVVNVENSIVAAGSTALEVLEKAPGVVVVDNPAELQYPMPLMAHDKDEVFVGRLRRDETQPKTLNMWIVADNLRKGAATNAVQIGEYLLKHGLIG